MLVEWVLGDPLYFSRNRITPKDSIQYVIPKTVIDDTESVLLDYAKLTPSNEGLVYWSGIKDKNKITIMSVIAPQTDSTWGSIRTSNRSNFDVVQFLGGKKQVHIGQVHSHPGGWVDHSEGDDRDASFKTDGLISIVVPNYCKQGMSLSNCGVHRYTDGKFSRLSETYVLDHFVISDNLISEFVELRK